MIPRRIVRNKKGYLLNLMLGMFSLVIYLILVFILIGKTQKFEKSIGEHQLSLLQAYQRGERNMFYIGTSAKYAAQQVAYVLADQGGYGGSAGKPCGEYLGYTLWNTEDEKAAQQECYPSGTAAFDGLFNIYLNEYISTLPATTSTIHYVTSVTEHEKSVTIVGGALDTLAIPVGTIVESTESEEQIYGTALEKEQQLEQQAYAQSQQRGLAFVYSKAIPLSSTVWSTYSASLLPEKRMIASATNRPDIRFITLEHSSTTSIDVLLDRWKEQGSDVSCSYIVDTDGKVYAAFGDESYATCTNSDVLARSDQTAISIVLINSGFSDCNANIYPSVQMVAAKKLVAYLVGTYNLAPYRILGKGFAQTNSEHDSPTCLPKFIFGDENDYSRAILYREDRARYLEELKTSLP